MNPDSPKNPGEELELRITALLLGELSDEEASALRRTIAQDTELARLHDRLKFAIELARETSAAPLEEEMAKPEELKLAPGRRARLLATFAAPKILKLKQQRRTRRRELLALAAMIVVLLAAAGMLMPLLDRGRVSARRVVVLRGSAGLPHATSADNEFALYLERAQAQATKDGRRIQISGQVDMHLPSSVAPANQAAATPTPARPSRSDPRYESFAERNAFSLTPPPENKEGRGRESGRSFSVSLGRIALPEPEAAPGEGGQISQESATTDFFADSNLPSENRFIGQFAWSAPMPGSGGGGGGGVGGGMKPTDFSGVPQLGERFDQNGQQNLGLLNGEAAVQRNALTDDMGLVTPLPARQPPPAVDPATGLPVNGVGTLATTVSPNVMEPKMLGYINGTLVTNGTQVAGGAFYYGVQPTTNSFGGASSSTFATTPADQRESFQKRLGNIVNQAAPPAIDGLAANVPAKSDFDGDGAVRAGRFKTDDSSWAMARQEQKKAFLDVNHNAVVTGSNVVVGGEYVSTTEQLRPRTLAGQSAHRRSEIVLPSQSRGDAEKQVAAGVPVVVNGSTANPAPKSVEQLVDLQDQPTSEVLGMPLSRDLDSLRLARERLALRIIKEKVDAAIPRVGIVEIVDPAEAKPPKSPTVLERIGGAFRGGVERSARVRVEKDAPDVAGLNDRQYSRGYDPYWVQTETEAIQSKSVLSNVAAKLDLERAWGEERGGERLKPDETVALLKKMTTVSTDPKTGLIDIKVKSEKAEESARIANTIAEVYREQRLGERRQSATRGIEGLEKALVEQDQKIAQVEQNLEQRKKEKAPEDVGGPKPATTAAVPQPEIFTADNPFSTFSLNVSDVSFKLAAASLEKGALPDVATVRTEEFINAFDYRDPEPAGSAPIAFAWDRARYPFAHDRDLVRFSVKTAASGREPGRPLNLVLLLDNSGSMERADRLRIREECLRVLASQLQTNDRVSVVAFARTAQLWVDGLAGDQAGELPQRVGGLTPQGGTNLEEAMNLAYRTALRHFLAGGVNRVVLLTDGAANLGDVEPESLKKKVEANRQQGIALDCFGIGWEGYNDDLLEVLSRNGDGRYGFVNTPEAASSEFAGQLAGALKVAASDVKVQVEFNPRRVTAYRQLGYAKHQLKKEQFRDNTVDAAEIGAAEAGNALYVVQVNPRGEGPLGTVRVRFKVPGTSDYRVPYDGAAKPLEQSAFPMRLAATAAAFSEWLVSSPYAAEVGPDRLLTYLSGVPESCPADPRPKKLEWMIRQAKSVAGK
jgi:secreted protein with Ig-like and vWFA domain/anti-sigma factor RsiW